MERCLCFEYILQSHCSTIFLWLLFLTIPSSFVMSLPLLYPKTLGNGCGHIMSPSHVRITCFEIEVIRQRIQSTH
jgi:hypothetical protein